MRYFFSSSWCRGSASDCDCDTPWTFHFSFILCERKHREYSRHILEAVDSTKYLGVTISKIRQWETCRENLYRYKGKNQSKTTQKHPKPSKTTPKQPKPPQAYQNTQNHPKPHPKSPKPPYSTPNPIPNH